jgi:four helix bundle protein
MKIKSFKDLLVWKLANNLSVQISQLVKTFPKDEKYELVNQLKRSSRSVPANIAEGWGRYHFNDKLIFYDRSFGSLEETENHLIEAMKNFYISGQEMLSYNKKIVKIRVLLQKMIKNIIKARNEYNSNKGFHPRKGIVSAHKRSFRPAERDCFRPPGRSSSPKD